MADPQQLQFLLECLQQPSGRKRWLEYKLKVRWIDLSASDFTGRDLRGYDLSDANLSSGLFLDADLVGCDISDAALGFSDMRRARLRNAIMDRADLSLANLQAAELVDACMEEVNLSQAKLQGASLVGADLAGATLENADLRGASLKFVRLSGARLVGANVAGADLTGTVMDDEAPAQLRNFDQALVDDRRYREMRSRLKAGAGQPGAGTAEPILEQAPEPEAAAPRPGNGSQAAVDADAEPAAHGIPVREQEPDLSTVEGCYRILELDSGATTEEVVRAFRAKAKIYHPDMVRHLTPRLQELAQQEFLRVRQAYERLERRTARPLINVNWVGGMPRRGSPYEYSSAEYEALARVNPANTAILYNLAWKYFEEGRYSEAIQGFLRVLGIDPNDEDAQFNLMITRLYVELALPPAMSGE